MKVAYIDIESDNIFLDLIKKLEEYGYSLSFIISFSTKSAAAKYAFNNKIPFCYINSKNSYYKDIIIDKIQYNEIDMVWMGDVYFEVNNKKNTL